MFGAGCTAETGSNAGPEETGHAAEALTTSTISNHVPDGIVYSTGNVYFTTHVTGIRFLEAENGARDTALRIPLVTTASVLRTSKYSTPGQEITLWSETGSRFGDIVWALVDGTYYGYFLSENLSTAEVTIKRVPLAGGTAIDLAGGIGTDIDIVNGHHLLDTDGTNLYWQDATTVRSMPINGGAQTVLDTVSPNTPTPGTYVVGGNVNYASSTSVFYVPSGGTTTPPSSRTIVTPGQSITTISAAAYGSDTMVAWGLRDGSAAFLLTGITLGIEQPSSFIPTSLAPAGGEVFAYINCGSAACNLGGSQLGSTNPVSAGAFGLDIDNSVPSTITAFWGDTSGVHRVAAPFIE